MKVHPVLCLLPLLLGCFSCQKNEQMLYEGSEAVYFSETTSQDSIQYSFASNLKQEDVIQIPIMIIGQSENYDRVIKYHVSDESTAVSGLHYNALEGSCVLKAGEVKTSLDVVVTDKDPELENGTVKLVIDLDKSDLFELGFPDRRQITLIITKKLLKPKYWDMPLSLYYGQYTKAKHRLCIQIQGFDFPDNLDLSMINDYISYGRLVYASLMKNPIWDEETQTEVTADWIPL